MSTQLTISIELIAFMKWVLEHKHEMLHQFMTHCLDPELEHTIRALVDNGGAPQKYTDDLYETLVLFVQSMETIINTELNLQPAQAILEAHPGTKRTKTHRKNCAARAAEQSASTSGKDEALAIESPTQRMLYQSLCEESGNNSTVH